MPELTVRPYTLDDLPAVLTLTRAALGTAAATPMTPAFWRWKHHANPFGASYGLVAWPPDGSAAAGLRILLRWQFQTCTGGPVAAVRAVDTATHPAYRRQGVFTQLTLQAVADLTRAGVDLIYNTPNRQSLPGYLAMGWQTVATWPIALRLLRPLRMVRRRLARQQPPPLSAWEHYFGPALLPWRGFDRVYAGQWQPLAAAWERQRRQVGLRTVRPAGYWHWRYGDPPHLTYAVSPLLDGPRLVGFAILRPNVRFGWQEAVLADLAVAAPSLGPRLLAQVARHLRTDYVAAHFAAGTLEAGWLRRAGYWPAPRRGMCFATRTLQPSAALWAAAAAWDLTLGDLELF